MSSKIMSVFYGLDRLPYKDSARNVHYPIMESALITGENNTRTIRFFTGLIGGNERQWIANIKKPDGTLAYQLCSNAQIIDGEYCVELDISYLYANQRGEVYIGLQGYDNSAVITYNSETLSYEISGDPTVIATGTIKILVNYAPNIFPKGETLQPTTEQLILASLGGKLDKTSGIIVLGALPVSASGYPNGQLIIVKTTGAIYQSNGATFDRINLQVKCGDIDIRNAISVLPTWYYGKVVKGSDTPFADAVNVLYHFTDKDNGLVIYNGQVFVINSGTWAKLVKSVGGEVIENEFYDGNTKTPSHRLVNLSEVASSISVALQSAKDYTDDEVAECLESAKDYTDLVDDKVDNFIATKGQNSGLAPLDSNGKIAISYIPSTIARTSESATFIQLTLDPTTYILKAKLIAKDATQLWEAQVDLPLETMVVSGSYDAVNKKLVLVLKNGQTIDIPVAQLVSGLVATSDIKNNLTSIDTDKPLSANQGKVLNDLITALTTIIPTDLGVDTTTNEMFLKHGSSEIEGQTRQKFKTIGGQSIFGDGNIPVGGGSASIDDTTIATDKTWSSNKTNSEISKVRTIALSGAKHISVNTNVSAIEEVSYSMHIVYKMDGTRLTTWQDFVDFVANGNPMATPTLKNSAFNSNDNNILANATYGDYLIVNISGNTYYVISLSSLKISESEYGFDMQTLKQMDLFILGSQQNIPDRFIDFSNNNLLGFKALEGKVQSMTFATGTNQGQFKANNVDYSVKGLGTSDSPSFAGVKNNNYTHASKVFKITYSDDSVENVSFLAYAIPPASYTITNTLSNCSNSNNATTINEGQNYTATLTANNGYVMSSVAITKGTTDITATAYNSSTGAISISSVDGNISITATARLLATYTITNNLTHTNNSNTATSITEGYSYNGTLSAESGYEISSVLIKVNGVDKTSQVYNASTGAISISGVNGNIEITATSISISEFSITNTLKNATSNNPAIVIGVGETYTATLTPTTDMHIALKSVKMGGTDITSTAYSEGVITIPNVSGNIEIVATAIPNIYTAVEYLQSDGNQYIDTGWIPDTEITDIKCKYAYAVDNPTESSIAGTYNPRFYFGIGGSKNFLFGIAGSYKSSETFTVSGGTIYNAHFINTNNGLTQEAIVNGTSYGTVSGQDTNYGVNLYLFGRNNNNVADKKSRIKMYSISYLKGANPFHDYIAVRRTDDDKPGMLDLTNNDFKVNSGSGTDFVLGPDIE